MGTPIPIGDEYGTRRLPRRGAKRSAGGGAGGVRVARGSAQTMLVAVAAV